MKKKEATTPPPLLLMFEEIFERDHHLFQDAKDWRECQWACHVSWLNPLLDDGLIVEDHTSPNFPDGADTGGRERFNYHFYKATDKGIAWWIQQYASQVSDRRLAYVSMVEPWTGKGIGAELTFSMHWQPEIGLAAMAGIQDGLFGYVRFYSYPRGGEWNITVSLTRKGMEYLDSLPRLQLECA